MIRPIGYLSIIISMLYSSVTMAECTTPYTKFALVYSEDKSWGVQDENGKWMTSGWTHVERNPQAASFLYVENCYLSNEPEGNWCFIFRNCEAGYINVCWDDKENTAAAYQWGKMHKFKDLAEKRWCGPQDEVVEDK